MTKRKSAVPKISEADIQRVCSEYLQLDGWRVLRTDPVSDGSLAAEIKYAILKTPELASVKGLIFDIVDRCVRGKGFGEVGMADCLYIRYDYMDEALRQLERLAVSDLPCDTATQLRVMTSILWVEWKRKGGKAAPHQKTWHAAERARGALTLIAGEDFEASISGFSKWYMQSRLRRRVGLIHG